MIALFRSLIQDIKNMFWGILFELGLIVFEIIKLFIDLIVAIFKLFTEGLI